MTATPFPSLGCGIGLRREHYGTILEQWPEIDWFEAISENFMGREVVVAITRGKLDFGPWEQIFYGEFDGRRAKRVLIKVLGD